jgi:hypothetical protein
MATVAQRHHLHGIMEYLLSQEPKIHYAQIRPMTTIHYTEQQIHSLLGRGGSLTMDCSEAVTLLCKWAGLADPNGRNYNGTGYTGTMLANLRHYTNPQAAQTGGLVVFGPGAGEHVCMVQEPGHDPLLWSHGAERGPRSVRFSVEKSVHRPPAVFLSVARL